MMKTVRLCLIGNAHLTALKMGWEKLGDLAQGFAPAFFGSRGTSLKELTLSTESLEPVSEKVREMFLLTSGGKERIVPSEYDAFVLVGSGLGVLPIARLYETYRLARHIRNPRQYPISEDCLGEAVAAILWGSTALATVAKLRALTDAPIFVLPEPFPRALVKTRPEAEDCWTDESITNLIYGYFYQFQEQCQNEAGFTFVPQPTSTFVEEMFTLDEFSVGSVRFGEMKHSENELFHANPEYGAVFLKEVLGKFATSTA